MIFKNEKLASLEGNEYEKDKRAFNLAMKYILEHPGEFVRNLPGKLKRLYIEDYEGFYWNYRGIKSKKVQDRLMRLGDLASLYYRLVMAGFFLFLFLSVFYYKSSFPTLGLWIIAYFTLIYMIFFADLRFHFPMIPWIVMYTSAFLAKLLDPELTENET